MADPEVRFKMAHMGMKALIVSPNTQITRVLRDLLHGLGVDALVCSDVPAAATALAQGPVDAVLVDWDIEKLVKSVPREARRNASPNLVVVALLDARLGASQAFQQGANFVLYKPISVERAKVSLQFALKLTDADRRRSHRRPVHVGTKISFGAEDQSVTLLNVSPTGTSLQSPRGLPADCKIYFQFQLPGETTFVRMAGTVVWQDAGGRTGIRFSALPEASKRQLEQWVSASEATSEQWETISNDMDIEVEEELPADVDPDPEPIVVRQPVPLANKGERRKQARYTCSSGVQVTSAESRVPNWCNLTDISLGGCYIEMTMPFPKDTQLVLELRTQAVRLRTHGIVRSTNPGYGMGVQFDFETAEQKAQLQEIIEFLVGGSSNNTVSGTPPVERRRRPRS